MAAVENGEGNTSLQEMVSDPSIEEAEGDDAMVFDTGQSIISLSVFSIRSVFHSHDFLTKTSRPPFQVREEKCKLKSEVFLAFRSSFNNNEMVLDSSSTEMESESHGLSKPSACPPLSFSFENILSDSISFSIPKIFNPPGQSPPAFHSVTYSPTQSLDEMLDILPPTHLLTTKNTTTANDPTLHNLSLREITPLAIWTVSSHKPSCGVPSLLHPSPQTFWQSDGPQPHLLTLHFSRTVHLQKLRIYLDFKLDESYTPSRMECYGGMHGSDYGLVRFAEWKGEEPRGWQDFDLGGSGPGGGDGVKVRVVQLRVLENHQNGKDTHVRGVQVFAKDERGRRGRGRVMAGAGTLDDARDEEAGLMPSLDDDYYVFNDEDDNHGSSGNDFDHPHPHVGDSRKPHPSGRRSAKVKKSTTTTTTTTRRTNNGENPFSHDFVGSDEPAWMAEPELR